MSKFITHIYQLTDKQKLQLQEDIIDTGQLLDNELFAKTLYTAISPGTELAAYNGSPPLRPMKVYPRLMGYCNVAVIEKIGSHVKSHKPGDYILTFQSHRTAFKIKEEQIICRVPASANLSHAVTTYLFHLGYNALLNAGFFPGHNVGVVGLGTLGVTTMSLCSAFGTKCFGLTEQSGLQEKISNQFNDCYVFKKSDSYIHQKIDIATHGVGLDIIVNTSNSWEDWKLALQLAQKKSKICSLGFPGREHPMPPFNPLSSEYFYDKQLSFIACGISPDLAAAPHDIRFTIKRNCSYLLDLIISKKINPDIIIGHHASWRDLDTVYREMTERKIHFTTILNWQ